MSSNKQAFTTSPSDRVVGVKLQPFHDLALVIGTEFARNGSAHFLSSRISWEWTWTREVERFGGLSFGLAAQGSVGSRQTAYAQSVSGHLNVPLGNIVEKWETHIRLAPGMNIDTARGSISTLLTCEIVGQRVLASRVGAFTSVLRLKAGYHLAPHTRPGVFAGLEIRISPNL